MDSGIMQLCLHIILCIVGRLAHNLAHPHKEAFPHPHRSEQIPHNLPLLCFGLQHKFTLQGIADVIVVDMFALAKFRN